MDRQIGYRCGPRLKKDNTIKRDRYGQFYRGIIKRKGREDTEGV